MGRSLACFFSMLSILALGRVCALAGEIEDSEIERRLGSINKPSIKTIETEYGQIIDCVDIYKQPAFDHPLLKNHKIQMTPSGPLEVDDVNDHSSKPKPLKGLPGIEPLGCPEGTVPIIRTTKEDLLKEKLHPQSALPSPSDNNDPNDFFAVMDVTYFYENSANATTGAKARINTQNPRCKSGEASGAHIWLSDGPNVISAGWLVDPNLYGDDKTHYSISWKGKGGTGCIDAQCPGFVLTNKDATLGVILTQISVYEGQQYDFPIYIYQDGKKDWWLAAGDTDHNIGYWPKELFSGFENGATALSFGGYTKRISNQPSPQMGSGVIPDCQLNHASYFRLVEFQYNGKMMGPFDTKTRSSCADGYKVQISCFPGHEKDIGVGFLFGGPGGDCK